jgi:Tfp pilus assembly protein PilO
MDISLSKLPWWAQIGAFVLVCGGATYGFWHFYVSEMQADVNLRQTRLNALRGDIARGVATARRLPEFESQVTQLEQRLDNLKQVLPEEKDPLSCSSRSCSASATASGSSRGSGPGR